MHVLYIIYYMCTGEKGGCDCDGYRWSVGQHFRRRSVKNCRREFGWILCLRVSMCVCVYLCVFLRVCACLCVPVCVSVCVGVSSSARLSVCVIRVLCAYICIGRECVCERDSMRARSSKFVWVCIFQMRTPSHAFLLRIV